MACATAVGVETWSNTEAGKTVPRVDIVERMAVALDVAPSWLAYEDECSPDLVEPAPVPQD